MSSQAENIRYTTISKEPRSFPCRQKSRRTVCSTGDAHSELVGSAGVARSWTSGPVGSDTDIVNVGGIENKIKLDVLVFMSRMWNWNFKRRWDWKINDFIISIKFREIPIKIGTKSMNSSELLRSLNLNLAKFGKKEIFLAIFKQKWA